MRIAAITATAVALAAAAVLNVRSTFGDPVTWTPDALFYQARLLEIRGADHDEALARAFRGPISTDLRQRDPEHVGDPRWVSYSERFYERRVAVPAVGAALYPVEGNRSLLTISLAGYVAAILAVFALLLVARVRLAVAGAVAAATVFLPPLVNHSSFPLTDSWGLALEACAFAAAALVLIRGPRWLALWVGTILLLSFVRDSTWVPVLAAGVTALRFRSRTSLWLFGSGIAAALPALLAFRAPVRPLLALIVNDYQLPTDTSWSFILGHYPHAVTELVRANGGFLRDGEWYTAAYFLGGALCLLVFLLKRRPLSPLDTLVAAGACLAVVYVLAAPGFSAFRLELAFVPMAAYGIALAAEALLAAVRGAAARREVVTGSPGASGT